MPLTKLGITMLKHNMEDGAYMDMSNLGKDIKDIYNEAFSTREDRVLLARNCISDCDTQEKMLKQVSVVKLM